MEFSDISKVVCVSPSLIQIEVFDAKEYQCLATKVSIGSYLKILDDNGLSIITIVQSFRIKDLVREKEGEDVTVPVFILEAQPVGFLDKDGNFKRGGQQIAIPPTKVEMATDSDLEKIYKGLPDEKQFCFSSLSQSETIRAIVDGDRFFGKHIGVVGSTGSGKSCTVAKILQEGIKGSTEQDTKGILNNSHILIFDLHGEYNSAFPKANTISINNLLLPYWLMNSEELEELFIESREQNSHNQVSQFKLAVIKNKEMHNPTLKVDYDEPVYFSLDEVYRYIYNQNRATKDAKTRELKIVDIAKFAGTPIEHILFQEITFEEKAQGKINDGPYAGEFDRFVSRIETKLRDERLDFFLKPRDEKGGEYKTEHLIDILKQFLGYSTNKSNITIIDLSGIPFEVLSLVVSLITRLIFTFAFHFKKNLSGEAQKVPFLLVYEEAHNYIPQSEGAKYHSVKKSIERIAKEGRKYGVSLMIVSQRPSEISETIFSQCNNFVAMRLTNPTDQQYIKRLLPDNINAVTDTLPILEKQEAIIIGDAISIPSIVKIDEISDKPNSNDVDFHQEWKKDWYDVVFDKVIKHKAQEDASTKK